MSQFTWPERPDEAHNHASPEIPADAGQLADDGDALTAHEQAIERKLLADGAGWRRSVSPTLPGVSDFVARAEQRLASERASATPPTTPRARPELVDAPRQTPPIPLTLPSMNRGQFQKGTYPVTASRWRGLAGVAVALIVVGMVGLLLAHNLSGGRFTSHTGAGGTATAASTPFATATPYPGNGGGGNQPYPTIAPSNPQIVYFAQNAAIGRSVDGGKTYKSVATPPTTLKNVAFVVSVSPLDANHLIATGTGDRNTDMTCPAAPGQAGAHAATQTRELAETLSGYGPCSQSFFSADGGKTWNYLALPYHDVIGSLTTTNYYLPSATLFAQGSRLYTAIGAVADYGILTSTVGAHPAELMVSADDGATWQVASNGLGSSICDFAPAPSGDTVYAIVAATSCDNEVPSALSLWRSADAGASWSQVSTLPTPYESGIMIAPSGAIYIDMPEPQSAAQGAHASAIIASVDGGVTFTRAPDSALVGANDAFSGPLGVLSDGSILMMTSHSDTQGYHTTFLAWQAGGAAWRKVGATMPHHFVEVVVVPQGGSDNAYLVDDAGKISHMSV